MPTQTTPADAFFNATSTNEAELIVQERQGKYSSAEEFFSSKGTSSFSGKLQMPTVEEVQSEYDKMRPNYSTWEILKASTYKSFMDYFSALADSGMRNLIEAPYVGEIPSSLSGTVGGIPISQDMSAISGGIPQISPAQAPYQIYHSVTPEEAEQIFTANREKFSAQSAKIDALVDQETRKIAESSYRDKPWVQEALIDVAKNLPQTYSGLVGAAIPYAGPLFAFGAMAASEEHSFRQLATELGLPREFSEKYAIEYGVSSGLIEYIETYVELASLGIKKIGIEKARKEVLDRMLKKGVFSRYITPRITNIITEMGTEVTQELLSYSILSNAVEEWNKTHTGEEAIPLEKLDQYNPASNSFANLKEAATGAFNISAFLGLTGLPVQAAREVEAKVQAKAVNSQINSITRQLASQLRYDTESGEFKLRDGGKVTREAFKTMLQANKKISAREAEVTMRVLDAYVKAFNEKNGTNLTTDQFIQKNISEDSSVSVGGSPSATEVEVQENLKNLYASSKNVETLRVETATTGVAPAVRETVKKEVVTSLLSKEQALVDLVSNGLKEGVVQKDTLELLLQVDPYKDDSTHYQNNFDPTLVREEAQKVVDKWSSATEQEKLAAITFLLPVVAETAADVAVNMTSPLTSSTTLMARAAVVQHLLGKRVGTYLWSGIQNPEMEIKRVPTFQQNSIAGGVYHLWIPEAIWRGESKLPLDTPLSAANILSRLSSMQGLSQVELNVYKEAGLEEFLGDKKRSMGEVAKWMEENGPTVEIKKLFAKDSPKVTNEAQELARMQHWYDSLSGPKLEQARRFGQGELGTGDLEDLGWTQEEISNLLSLRGFANTRDTFRVESATARFSEVNPKPLSEMPGAVDLLVRIPLKKDLSTSEWNKLSEREKEKYTWMQNRGAHVFKEIVKYSSSHYPQEGKNVVVFGRAYLEGDALYLFEVQRDVKPVETYEGSGKWQISGWLDLSEATNRGNYFSSFAEADAWLKKQEPLFAVYESLLLKAAIFHAQQQGAKSIIISDAETAMLTEGHDEQTFSYWTADLIQLQKEANLDPTKFKIVGRDEISLQRNEVAKILDIKTNTIVGSFKKVELGIRLSPYSLETVGLERKVLTNIDTFLETTGIEQEKGMRLHYDKILPKLAEKLTGGKGKRVEIGIHQNAGEFTKATSESRERDLIRDGFQVIERTSKEDMPRLFKPRSNLIFKNPDGTLKTSISGRLYDITSVQFPQSLFQQKKGQTQGATTFLSDGRALLNLFANGDFSTIIHEFSHIFLRHLSSEDIETICTWVAQETKGDKFKLQTSLLSVHSGTYNANQFADATTVHEYFARNFERYLREGKTPSATLKQIFEYAKKFLTRIYRNISSIPLAKDSMPASIRKIFDEMLTTKEERIGGKIRKEDGTLLDITLYKGRPVVKVAGSAQGKSISIYVENLIRGEKPNLTQAQFLGKSAVWVSPYVTSNTQRTLNIETDIPYTAGELSQMTDGAIRRIAGKFGIRNAKLMPIEDLKLAILSRYTDEGLLDNPLLEGYSQELSLARQTAEKIQERGESAYEFLVEKFDALTDSIVDYVQRRHPDNPFVREVCHKARLTIDKFKEIRGQLKNTKEEVQKLTSSSFFTSEQRRMREATQSLGELQEVAPGAFVNRLRVAIEDTKYQLARPLSVEEQKIVYALKKLIRETGKVYKDAGGKIRKMKKVINKAGEVEVAYEEFDFEPSVQGNILSRQYTETFFEIMNSKHPKMIAVKKAIGEAIFIMGGQAEFEAFQDFVKQFSNKDNRHVSMEFARNIDKFPTHIKFQGHIYALMESSPFHIAESMVQSTSLKSAFISFFPQQEKAQKVLQDAWEQATKEKQHFHYLMRALNGVPIFDREEISRGDATWGAMQIYKALSLMYKTKVLGFAVFGNIPETEAKVATFLGRGRLEKAKLALTGDASVRMGRKLAKLVRQNPAAMQSLSADLERMGAVSHTLAHFVIRSNVGVRQSVNEYANMLSRNILKITGLTGINSVNELIAAASALEMVKDFQQGKATVKDKYHLSLMGFTEEEIQKLTGPVASCPPSLYAAVVTRAPTFTQGTNLAPAERTLYGSWKHWGDLFAFTSYGHMTLARLHDITAGMIEAEKDRSTQKGEKRKNAWIAFTTALLSRSPDAKTWWSFQAGHVRAGMMALALRGMARYGSAYFLLTDWDDDDDGMGDDLIELITNSYVSAIFSGPISGLMYAYETSPSFDFGRAVTSVLFPLSVLGEISNVLTTSGPYKNMSHLEAIKTAAFTPTTAVQMVDTLRSTLGLGSKNLELAKARKDFYAWQRRKVGITRFEQNKKDKEAEEFGREMTLAVRELEKKQTPLNSEGIRQKMWEHLGNALKVHKGTIKERFSAMKMSLERKKILPADMNLLMDLRKNISPKAWNVLVQHDLALEMMKRGLTINKD